MDYGESAVLDHIMRVYKYKLKPIETRILFKEKGWRTVVGFQTRNTPHIGHEYVQKTALTFTDGIFVNPVIGRKKKGDTWSLLSYGVISNGNVNNTTSFGPRTSTCQSPTSLAFIYFELKVRQFEDLTIRFTLACSLSPKYQAWVISMG